MNKFTMTLFGLLMFNIQFMNASVKKFEIIERTTDSVVWQGQHQKKTITITKKPSEYEKTHYVVVTIPGEDILVGRCITNGFILDAAYQNRDKEQRCIETRDTPTTKLFKKLIEEQCKIHLHEPYQQN